MDLNKYIANKADKREIFHSNAHAQIASGAKIGSTGGGDSFAKRLSQQNRSDRMVDVYEQSKLYNATTTMPVSERRIYKNQTRGGIHSTARPAAGSLRQSFNAQPAPRSTGFTEPPKRNYNPYA